jgi:hypothetical protein
MAYSRANLQRVGPQNSNAPTLWTYSDTGSALTTIDGSGYFNDAADVLQVGDVIFVMASSSTFGIQVVRSNTRDMTASPPVEGVVDTSNAVALGSINSD